MSKLLLKLSAATLTVAGATALTACANPVEALINTGTEKLIEQATDGNLDIDFDGGGYTFQDDEGNEVQIGGNVKVPDAWPGLPIPAGKLLAATSDNTGAMLMIETTEGEITNLISTLSARGFTETENLDMGELKSVSLAGDGHTVMLHWIIQDDKQMLTYTVAQE